MTQNLKTYVQKNQNLIGGVASVLAILMFVSLLEVFFSNIRGDSSIVLQPLATAFNGLVWCLYAYAKNDIFVLLPNILALILGVITTISAFV